MNSSKKLSCKHCGINREYGNKAGGGAGFLASDGEADGFSVTELEIARTRSAEEIFGYDADGLAQ